MEIAILEVVIPCTSTVAFTVFWETTSLKQYIVCILYIRPRGEMAVLVQLDTMFYNVDTLALLGKNTILGYANHSTAL